MPVHHSIADKATVPSRRAWTTEDELEFIAGIGSHSLCAHDGREVLLRSYRGAIRKRWTWGAVSSVRVMQELDRLLR